MARAAQGCHWWTSSGWRQLARSCRTRLPARSSCAIMFISQSKARRRLALDILDQLVADKTVSLAPGWGPASIASVSAQVEAGIDRPTYARELYRLSQLLETLGQPKQALKRTGEGLKMSGGDVEGLCLVGRYSKRLGKFKDADSFFRQAWRKSRRRPCRGGPWRSVPSPGRSSGRGRTPRGRGQFPCRPRLSALNLLGVAHLRLGHHQQGRRGPPRGQPTCAE